MASHAPARVPVVFLAPSFESVNNGPAIYARYLWESLVDDEQIDFHLVAPQLPFKHSQLHESGKHSSSKTQYSRLQRKGFEVAGLFSSAPIVHSNTGHTMWLFRKYSGPTIIQINDYDAATVFKSTAQVLKDYGPRRLLSLVWRHKMESVAVSFATRVVCNSQYTQSQIRCHYPQLRDDQSQVIYKAVDLQHFLNPPELKFPYSLIGKRRILFVGSNWRRKGLDTAIQALSMLNGDFDDTALIVAGEESQKADSVIRQLPMKLGVDSRVQFLGRISREHLPDLFRQCNVVTLPSRQEALGVAVLEALAAGLPVVASDVGGIPEILENSIHSIMIPSESPKELAAALDKVLLSSKDKASVAEESRDIATEFRKSNMLAAVKKLYHDLEASRLEVPGRSE